MPIISTRDTELHKRVKLLSAQKNIPIYEIMERLTRIGLDLGLLDVDKATLGKLREELKK